MNPMVPRGPDRSTPIPYTQISSLGVYPDEGFDSYYGAGYPFDSG